MCTVIIRVDENPMNPVRMLAIRDEDPERSWDPLGAWWPTSHVGVVGVRDSRAGGAWLAAFAPLRRVSVALNRADVLELPPEELGSRGTLVLDVAEGATVPAHPRTHGFNIVTIAPGEAEITSWDARSLRTLKVPPGTHMIAHGDLDDETPRIVQWLEDFRSAKTTGEQWWQEWVEVLARSAELGPTDDRAIIRDNRPFGYPTQSLLACVASVSLTGIDVRYGELDHAGLWNPLTFAPAR